MVPMTSSDNSSKGFDVDVDVDDDDDDDDMVAIVNAMEYLLCQLLRRRELKDENNIIPIPFQNA